MSTTTFTPGTRYPLTLRDALVVMRQGWPITQGTPDLTRGRRFLKSPGDWEFWTTDGRKISFSVSTSGILVSQSKEADPNLPEPL